MYFFVSNKLFEIKFFFNFSLIFSSSKGLLANRIIKASYSFSVLVISSVSPNAVSKLPATLEAKLLPNFVINGVPAQSASAAVVCPLKLNVSKKISAKVYLAR